MGICVKAVVEVSVKFWGVTLLGLIQDLVSPIMQHKCVNTRYKAR